jgi:uncharacterized LabA/DUF88 family protein
MRTTKTPLRVALLIDAENVHNHYSSILRLAELFGTVAIKRAYADWKKLGLSEKQLELLALGIERVQQDQIGRNATDQRLAKEADDLRKAKKINTFIIASGDRYYLPLCQSIQKQNKHVLMIGARNQTSTHYAKHGIEFAYLENLVEYLRSAPIA